MTIESHDRPRLSTDQRSVVLARCPDWMLLGGLGMFGTGRIWLPDVNNDDHYGAACYESAPFFDDPLAAPRDDFGQRGAVRSDGSVTDEAERAKATDHG